MASYYINENAAEELRRLANSLLRNGEFLNESMKRLRDTWYIYENNLGIYGEAAEELLGELERVSEERTGALKNLSFRILEMANAIQEVLTDLNLDIKGSICLESKDLSRGIPARLQQTQTKWHSQEDGSEIYGEPEKLLKSLSRNQGSIENYEGTCGIICCENILRMAGISISQQEILDYASNHRVYYEDGTSEKKALCESSADPSKNGETDYKDRQAILAHYGIDTEAVPQDIHSIAEAVSDGRGVMLSVHSNTLYREEKGSRTDLHAVNVIGIKKDMQGSLTGFYICDPAAEKYKENMGIDAPVYYSAERIQKSLSEKPCLITGNIIR